MRLITLFRLAPIVLILVCANAFAQDAYSIRVEPHQVIVPTFVYVKDGMTSRSQKEWECSLANAETFYKLRLSDPFQPKDCDETEMRDLAANDFRIFEDGIEQKVQDVTPQRVAIVNVRDSAGWHVDNSYTPRGTWSSADLGPLLVPSDTGHSDNTGWHPSSYYASGYSAFGPIHFIPGSAGHFYRVAYVPPKSEEGSCHEVKVEVSRANTSVFARSHYCNTRHATTDSLEGTKLGEQLLNYLASGRKSKINLSLQTAVVHQDANGARVDIAIEFPWDSLEREWKDGTLHATIGTLGMVYKKDGTLATRFSDLGCCSEDRPNYLRTKKRSAHDLDASLIPTRYETQIDLPPNDYSLRIVLGDGQKFGLIEASLKIDPYDGEGMMISSVALCNRFRNAEVAKQEAATASLAPLYVPLVSKGMQLSPTGNTQIRKGHNLIAYFEVEDPSVVNRAVKVRTRLKITRNGNVKIDTGMQDASSWGQAGSSLFPVAQEIALDKLPTGSYRLEVQASDTAGGTTVWRAADFSISF
jgi:hypothetical protein